MKKDKLSLKIKTSETLKKILKKSRLNRFYRKKKNQQNFQKF